MKKLSLYVLTALMLVAVMPLQVQAIASTTPSALVAPKPSDSEIADALMTRLMEIQGMGHANLSASDKKVLRNEVRQIRSELKALGRGVYLSVGAIIIIILLLILLL